MRVWVMLAVLITATVSSPSALAARHASPRLGLEVGTNAGATIDEGENFVGIAYPATGLLLHVFRVGALDPKNTQAVLQKIASTTGVTVNTAPTLTPEGIGVMGVAITIKDVAYRGVMALLPKGKDGSVLVNAMVPAADFNDNIAIWATEMAKTTTLLPQTPAKAAIGPPGALDAPGPPAPAPAPAPAAPAPSPAPAPVSGGADVNAAKAAFDGFYVQSADGFLQLVNLDHASSRLKIQETGRRARCKKNPDGAGCDFDPFICGNGDAKILELQARVMSANHVAFVAAVGVDRVAAHIAVNVKKQRGGFVVDSVECAP